MQSCTIFNCDWLCCSTCMFSTFEITFKFGFGWWGISERSQCKKQADAQGYVSSVIGVPRKHNMKLVGLELTQAVSNKRIQICHWLRENGMNTVFDAFKFKQFSNMKALIVANISTTLDLADISSPFSNVSTNWVSSAKRWHFTPKDSKIQGRPAMKQLNNTGPRTLPCGTPIFDSFTSENVVPVLTLKRLFSRYNLIQVNTFRRYQKMISKLWGVYCVK